MYMCVFIDPLHLNTTITLMHCRCCCWSNMHAHTPLSTNTHVSLIRRKTMQARERETKKQEISCLCFSSATWGSNQQAFHCLLDTALMQSVSTKAHAQVPRCALVVCVHIFVCFCSCNRPILHSQPAS